AFETPSEASWTSCVSRGVNATAVAFSSFIAGSRPPWPCALRSRLRAAARRAKASRPPRAEGAEARGGGSGAHGLIGEPGGVHRARGQLRRGVKQQLTRPNRIPGGVGCPRFGAHDIRLLMREGLGVAEASMTSLQCGSD